MSSFKNSLDRFFEKYNIVILVEKYGIVIVVFLMILVLHFLQPGVFLSFRNMTNIMKQIAMNALLSIGMFIVILTAGIDLSVGSVMALSMLCLATVNRAGTPWPIVILVAPLVGLACGAINGVGLTWLRLPHPFIMTLGMLNIARGLTNLVSGGAPIGGVSEPVRYLGAAKIRLGTLANDTSLNLPVSLFVVAFFYVLAWFFLNKTATGRHIYAIGGNPHAARVSGVNVDRLLVLAYMLCGFTAGMAGLLLAGRTGTGFPNAGISAELDAIAAVIIGGASFFGGRGTVIGVFCGVFIMGLLRNGLNLMDVSVFWQQVLIGIVIILAVYADVLRRRAAYRT